MSATRLRQTTHELCQPIEKSEAINTRLKERTEEVLALQGSLDVAEDLITSNNAMLTRMQMICTRVHAPFYQDQINRLPNLLTSVIESHPNIRKVCGVNSRRNN